MEKKQTAKKKLKKVGPYILLQQIGKGSYSTVFLAKTQNDQKRYAIKQISLQNTSTKQIQRMHLEINVLSVIKHENIVSLIDYKQTSKNLYLVFQFCKHSDLNNYIKKQHQGKLPQQNVKKIMIQIKNAFKVIRNHRIVHRDLKLSNILVTQKLEIKLADFGFAKFLQENQFFQSCIGTPMTMAPEVFENKLSNEKCDIWSLGIIAYQMLVGGNPFFKGQRMSRSQILEAYKNQIFFPAEISEEAKNFITKSLERNLKERISFQDLFQHPWFLDLIEIPSPIFKKKNFLNIQFPKDVKPRNPQEIHIGYSQMMYYSLVENLINNIENVINFNINLAKKIMDSKLSKKKLGFIGIMIILKNLDNLIKEKFKLIFESKKNLIVGQYEEIRNLQLWPLSQFSKRLPNYMAKNRAEIQSFLINHSQKYISYHNFTIEELVNQYCTSIKEYLSASDEIRPFLKLKIWDGPIYKVKIESSTQTDKAIEILTQNLNIPNQTKFQKDWKEGNKIFKISFQGEKRGKNLEQLKIEHFQKQQ